ncbi:MAG TPA: ATP-binding protein, partial [Candidatus Acidoferrum sp.]|nr:ATP-binding protein [Candidatus Acidoferrum sp.]
TRHRQYQVRDLLTQLELEKDHLEERVKDRTRELNRSVRFLEQFTYSMAHDLRAPLRAIRSYTGLLSEDYAQLLDEQGRRMIGKVESAAGRLDSLINDLLSLARLSNLEVPLLPISVDSVVDGVVYALDEEIRRTDAVVEKQRCNLKAFGNPVILKQVLENFLANAIKYSEPRGRPEVRIWAEMHEGRVRVCVSDRGIGIAPEFLQKIFQPFQRLHGHEIPGSGIGLAIAAQGAERMGGSIGVSSQLGEGSTFWIDLNSSVNLPAHVEAASVA